MAAAISASAQTTTTHSCGTDEYYEEQSAQNPHLKQWLDNYLSAVEDQDEHARHTSEKKARILTIPVVFHVVHNYGPENISEEQIHDAMRVLNEDFRRLNTDKDKTRDTFQSRAADCEIQFKLATKGPNGEPTNGITRTVSELTYGGDNAVVNLKNDNFIQNIKWDYTRYLNIWVISYCDRGATPPSRVLAFASLPGSFSSLGWDGVVASHDYVGSIEEATNQGRGRTLTHEVGHWLGLLHTFGYSKDGGGCNRGDGISDTPPVDQANYGCPGEVNSCTSDNLPDMTENYMDYANGNCQNAFTNGQKNVMRDQLENLLRSKNASDGNLTFTGVDDAIASAPIPDFHVVSRNTIACPGEELEFEDLSWNGEVSDYNWTFLGGTPSRSTDENPKVTYTEPGTYKVTLQVSNSFGDNTVTKTEFITVLPAEGDLVAPITEDVESAGLEDEWSMETESIFGWKIDKGRAYSGNQSFRAHITASTEENQKFALISPPFDVSDLEGLAPKLSFRVAYALADNTTSGELLAVYASKDCGRTWNVLRGYLGKTTLKSTETIAPNWVPSQLSDWHTLSADIGRSGFDATSNLLFKFEVTSRAGNSVFIDDINVGLHNVGVPGRADIANLELAPNPSTGMVRLSFRDQSRSITSVSVLDISGRILFEKDLNYTGSIASTELNFQTNGMYYVRIGDEGGYTMKKVIIAK